MNEYLRNIIKQYNSATGSKMTSIDSKANLSELLMWLKLLEKTSAVYLENLEQLNFYNCFQINSYEIGKGGFDTLFKQLDTCVITPYSKTINSLDSDKMISSDFCVCDSNPTLKQIDKSGEINLEPLISSSELTFLTHNPYDFSKVLDWADIHNHGTNNIILGVFGNLFDKDRNFKLAELKEIKDRLRLPYIEKYVTIGDSYSCVLATDINKKKVKRNV